MEASKIMNQYRALRIDFLAKYNDARIKEEKREDRIEKFKDFVRYGHFVYIGIVILCITFLIGLYEKVHGQMTTAIVSPDDTFYTKLIMGVVIVMAVFLVLTLVHIFYFSCPLWEITPIPDFLFAKSQEEIYAECLNDFASKIKELLAGYNINVVKFEDLALKTYNIKNINADFYDKQDKVMVIINLLNNTENSRTDE